MAGGGYWSVVDFRSLSRALGGPLKLLPCSLSDAASAESKDCTGGTGNTGAIARSARNSRNPKAWAGSTLEGLGGGRTRTFWAGAYGLLLLGWAKTSWAWADNGISFVSGPTWRAEWRALTDYYSGVGIENL